MLAAGGVGTGAQMAAALAMGAQGVWTGSLWLTVEEADVPPAQMETLLEATQPRHRALALVHRQAVPHAQATTGPRPGSARTTPSRSACRCSSWSQATRSHGHHYPEQARDVNFNPVGQIIGNTAKESGPTARVVLGGG